MKKSTKQEFLESYEAYSDAIYQHCYFRVYNKHRAQDLMQETFMKAWMYVQEGQNVDNMRAFLYRIATNLIIDQSRKKKEKELDAMMEDSDANEPANEDHKEMERKVLLNEVKEVMEELNEEDREILTMRYFDDLDPKDIAEILTISANNVSVRLNRAMKELKDKIEIKK